MGRHPDRKGTLPADSLVFAGLVLATSVIVTGLSYLPALSLGPVLEQLARERRFKRGSTDALPFGLVACPRGLRRLRRVGANRLAPG
jgi:hypothetical protein